MHFYKVERDLGVCLKVKIGADAIRQRTYKRLTKFTWVAGGTISLKYVTTRTRRKNRSSGSTHASTTSTRR